VAANSSRKIGQNTRLNYVIPARLESLLARYREQKQVRPGPLVRKLVTDFVKGEVDIDIDLLEHPKGRRTSVDLPANVFEAFEHKCEEIEAPTKASIIAALLLSFLPNRVETKRGKTVPVKIPAALYSKIYDQFGPGPARSVVVEALSFALQQLNSDSIAETARVGN